MKRKREHEDNEAGESSEWMTSPGYAEGLNNLLLTPISGKGGKTSGRSKIAKYNKPGPHTPMSNAGEQIRPSITIKKGVNLCTKKTHSSVMVYMHLLATG